MLTGYRNVLAHGAAAEDSVPPSARDASFTPCGEQVEEGLELSLNCGTRNQPLNKGKSLLTGKRRLRQVVWGQTPRLRRVGGRLYCSRRQHLGRPTQALR